MVIVEDIIRVYYPRKTMLKTHQEQGIPIHLADVESNWSVCGSNIGHIQIIFQRMAHIRMGTYILHNDVNTKSDIKIRL